MACCAFQLDPIAKRASAQCPARIIAERSPSDPQPCSFSLWPVIFAFSLSLSLSSSSSPSFLSLSLYARMYVPALRKNEFSDKHVKNDKLP